MSLSPAGAPALPALTCLSSNGGKLTLPQVFQAVAPAFLEGSEALSTQRDETCSPSTDIKYLLPSHHKHLHKGSAIWS